MSTASDATRQTFPPQKGNLVGSIPTLPTILIIILAAIFASAQDQDKPAPVKEVREYIPAGTYDLPTREDMLIKLEKLMLSKFMEPLDTWISSSVFRNDIPQQGQTPSWFILVVEGDKFKGYPLFVKFYLDATEIPQWPDIEEVDGSIDANYDYITRKYIGIFACLEQQCITVMGDPEAKEAILYGEGHLYRIPTKDSDIKLLRKQDRIF